MSLVGSNTYHDKGSNAQTNAARLATSHRDLQSLVATDTLETFQQTISPADYAVIDKKERDFLNYRANILQDKNISKTYNIGNEDIARAIKLEDGLKKYLYDANFVALFNKYKTDPASMDKFRQLYPEFFKTRLAYISNVAKLQARVASLKLMGIQTRQDLDFFLQTRLLSKDDSKQFARMITTSIAELEMMTDPKDERMIQLYPKASEFAISKKYKPLKFNENGMLVVDSGAAEYMGTAEKVGLLPFALSGETILSALPKASTSDAVEYAKYFGHIPAATNT